MKSAGSYCWKHFSTFSPIVLSIYSFRKFKQHDLKGMVEPKNKKKAKEKEEVLAVNKLICLQGMSISFPLFFFPYPKVVGLQPEQKKFFLQKLVRKELSFKELKVECEVPPTHTWSFGCLLTATRRTSH